MPVKYRYPVKRSPKSDPQQYRVYRMENEAIGGRIYCQLQDMEIFSIAERVCKEYRVTQAKVVMANLGKWAAEWDNGVIKLNRQKTSARSILSILHELAHHVHWELGGEATLVQEAHGPEFMACYLSILDTTRVIPVVGMRAICAAWDVRYIDPGTRGSLARLQRITRAK